MQNEKRKKKRNETIKKKGYFEHKIMHKPNQYFVI